MRAWLMIDQHNCMPLAGPFSPFCGAYFSFSRLHIIQSNCAFVDDLCVCSWYSIQINWFGTVALNVWALLCQPAAWKWKISATKRWQGASERHTIVLINHQPCPRREKCMTTGAYGSAPTKPGFATVPSVLRMACRASITVSGRGTTAATGCVCWRVHGCAYRVTTYQACTLYCTPLHWKLTASIEDFRFSYNLQVAVRSFY